MTTEEFNREAALLRPVLVAVAERLLGDRRYAEDAAQDALMKLWPMHTDLRLPVAALAKAVVRNICVDRLRRHKPTVKVEDVALAVPAAAEPHDDPFARIMHVVDTLPAAQQVTVRLRHIDGLDTAEIAKLTGASEAAVRKQLSRARMAIREYFLKHNDDE